jgi:hypothetical protein
MTDEPTRYVPTDQDLRSSAVYTAERLVTAKMQNGAPGAVSNPAALTIAYAETLYTFIKEGRTNG